MKWNVANIPNLAGKTAIVTGANSGLGYQIALALASQDCQVILACRNLTKANLAKETILRAFPHAKLRVEILDLANLHSIADFALRIKENFDHIDLLINNAAVLNVAPNAVTADGFGAIMGSNCLGPFALTAQLFPLLEAAQSARIVTVSSDSHKFTDFKIDDLTLTEGSNLNLYAKSKFANLIFAFELAERLKQKGSPVSSLAAHPGFAVSQLSDAKQQGANKWFAQFIHVGMKLVAQSAADGALPMLYAATAPLVSNGDFYGPDGLFGLRGNPKKQIAARKAYNRDLGTAFWQRCEALTQTQFNLTHKLAMEVEATADRSASLVMQSSRNKIAVIGGTGFIGYHIVNELIQHQYDVTIITRHPDVNLPDHWQGRVQFKKIDAQKATEEEFKTALIDHQGVIFAAGADPGDKALWEKNVTTVQRLIAGARQAGCDRAVLLGSYYTYFKKQDAEFGAALQQNHTYIDSRFEQAKRAREAGAPRVAVSVLEIPWVFGVTPNRPSRWKSLIKWVNSRLPLFAPEGGTAAVSVETVAKLAVAALANRADKNIPVAEGNFTWSELYNKLARVQRSVHRIPNWLMNLVGFVWDGFYKLTQQAFHGLNPRHFLSKVFTRELFMDLRECRQAEQELGLDNDLMASTQRMNAAFAATIDSCLAVEKQSQPIRQSFEKKTAFNQTSMSETEVDAGFFVSQNQKSSEALIEQNNEKLIKAHSLTK